MKTVLLVPGFKHTLDNRDYRSVLRAIETEGYTVQFVPINWVRTSVDDWIRALEKEYVKYQHHEVILAGFSFGAMTALVVAAACNPAELWLCSLSPCFAEDLALQDWDAFVAKSIGVKRAKNFRQLSFANLAQAVRCKTLLFIGELEAKQRPTLVTRVETAHRLIQGSTLIEIPGAEHDITAPAYLKAVTEAI